MDNSVWVVFDISFQDIDGYYAQYESLAVVCDSESSARNYIVNELRARKKEARNRYLYEKDRFAIWAVEDDGEFSSFEIWLKEHDYDFPDKDRIIKDEPFIYHSEFGEVGYMYREQEVLTVFAGGQGKGE